MKGRQNEGMVTGGKGEGKGQGREEKGGGGEGERGAWIVIR